MLLPILKWLFLIGLALIIALLIAGRLGALQGQRPADLGVKNGRLKPPSRTPNSVSSQADLYPEHVQRAHASIAPLPLRGSPAGAMQALRALVQAQPGASVVEARDDYLYAEFRSPTLRFVDDAEFWADGAAGVIQVRSASRLGRKDFGANRARIEALRERWTAALPP